MPLVGPLETEQDASFERANISLNSTLFTNSTVYNNMDRHYQSPKFSACSVFWQCGVTINRCDKHLYILSTVTGVL